MPYATKEMIDAIQASTPEWQGEIKQLHYCLGSDFDKFMDLKWLLEPMPPEMVEEYNRMHEEAKPRILEELISAHKQSVDGQKWTRHFDEGLGVEVWTMERVESLPVRSEKPQVSVRDLVEQLEKKTLS